MQNAWLDEDGIKIARRNINNLMTPPLLWKVKN